MLLSLPILLGPVLLALPQAQAPFPAEHSFQPIPARGQRQAMHGVWRVRGYGWIAEIAASRARFFDHSPAGTLEQTADPEALLVGMHFRVNADTLQLTRVPGSSTIYTWDRVPALPEACTTPGPDAADPVACFDYFWDVMQYHYGYFDVRGIDWEQRRDAYRPRVRPTTTDEELWEVFCDMLSGFHDDHMSLTGTVGGRELEFSDGRCRELDPALDAAFAAQDVIRDRDEFQRSWARGQKRRIREELLQDQYEVAAQDQVVWGRIGPIGYINIRGMGGFAQSDDPHDEVAGVHAVMSRVLTDLSDCEGMILDITTNTGGFDEVQMAISSHFVDERRLAFTKRPLDARDVEPQPFYLFPADGPRYLGPVALVTSDFSVSAAEDFTLAMRELPHVTHVGSRTRGAFSDILEKPLPNGWVLALSNEAYLDTDGRNWEGHGVPPEVPVPIFVSGQVETSHVDAIYRIVDALLAGDLK